MWRSLLWVPLFVSCAHNDGPKSGSSEPPASPTTAPEKPAATCEVITDEAQLAGCVGKIVTLRGTVTRTKQPTLVGVDVDAAYELGEQPGEATGRLETYTIEPREPDEPIVASRGPGTYFRLVGDDGLAKARAVP